MHTLGGGVGLTCTHWVGGWGSHAYTLGEGVGLHAHIGWGGGGGWGSYVRQSCLCLNPSNVASTTIGSSFFDPRCRHPFIAELPHHSRVVAPRVAGHGGEGPEVLHLRGGYLSPSTPIHTAQMQ